MLLCALLLINVLAAATSQTRYVLDDSAINAINADPASSWTAALNPRFEGVTRTQARALLGGTVEGEGEGEGGQPSAAARLPTAVVVHADTPLPFGARRSPVNFDCRQQWPTCMGAIRNQQQCGGCWAFGAAETLSDRFCISSKGLTNVTLSPQDLLSCGHVRTPPKYMLGCHGGVPEYAWKYLEDTGISTDECIPFVTTRDNMTEACPTAAQCDKTKYKAKMGSTRLLDGAGAAAQQYMSDPVNGGPIQAVFTVFDDFFAYSSGIYKHTNTSQKALGKHSIKVVGYGVDKLFGDYWTVANSWGAKWGMSGYFRIGVGQCNIESEMTFGLPLLG